MEKEVLVQNMGDNTSRVFSGESESQANIEMYGETAEFFANEIRKQLPNKDQEYVIADIGAIQGELLANILSKLPEYRFKKIAVDKNEVALTKNISSDSTIIANAEKLPFQDKSIDIGIVRYLLQWNNPEKQKQIISELARVVKVFALVEHVGADVVDTEMWREKYSTLFSGEEVPKMKRDEHFFFSRDEVEAWMSSAQIKFERLKDRTVSNAADVYIERYGLDAVESEKTRQILGDKNYFRQTDWVIFPKV